MKSVNYKKLMKEKEIYHYNPDIDIRYCNDVLARIDNEVLVVDLIDEENKNITVMDSYRLRYLLIRVIENGLNLINKITESTYKIDGIPTTSYKIYVSEEGYAKITIHDTLLDDNIRKTLNTMFNGELKGTPISKFYKFWIDGITDPATNNNI